MNKTSITGLKKKTLLHILNDCMVFNPIFNVIAVVSQWPVHLSVLSWSFCNCYSTQYSFKATWLLSHHCQSNGQRYKSNESCNYYYQPSKRILAKLEVRNSNLLISSLLNYTGLTHYQTTNFRLFQIERVCRRQFQI